MRAIVRPKRCRCSSWACPGCARVMGPLLQERIDQRVEHFTSGGHYVALFVTFTFDRTGYASPIEAWRFAQRNRSVSRAVKSFASAVGYNASGLWFAKLELQKAGWPHWHLIVMVPAASVPASPALVKRLFNEHWKYGFSTVRVWSRGDYLSKVSSYACKEAGNEGLRASGLPATRVRWISSSPGFWGVDDDGVKVDIERECSQLSLWDDEIDFDDVHEGETPDALHADRVDWCRRNAFLEFESSDGCLAVPINLSRRAMAEYVVERGPAISSVERYEESDVVRSFACDDVAAFVSFLEDEFCPNILRLEELERLRRFLRLRTTEFAGFDPFLSPHR